MFINIYYFKRIIIQMKYSLIFIYMKMKCDLYYTCQKSNNLDIRYAILSCI